MIGGKCSPMNGQMDERLCECLESYDVSAHGGQFGTSITRTCDRKNILESRSYSPEMIHGRTDSVAGQFPSQHVKVVFVQE